MKSRPPSLIGGVLLISGTAVGAGMLGLPVVTSEGGFFPSLLLFLLVWGLMSGTALFLLDVSLTFRGESNFLSMTEKTLGKFGKMICWGLYLLLLYALLAAYISACIPLFSSAFQYCFSSNIPSFLPPFFLPLLFGGCIYLGTGAIDYCNRFLIVGLACAYLFLIGGLPVHIDPTRLLRSDFSSVVFATPIILTSFGYQIIIPSLTTYLQHKKSLLKKTILLGSAIPLVVYVLWEIVVLGVVPFPLLSQAQSAGAPATGPLAACLHSPLLAYTANFFSFFAVITSFLGISLSLSDFLSDGFRLKKTKKGKILAILLTFIPPLTFIFSYENGFYSALNYAGILVAVLLGIFPCLMALRLRSYQTRRKKFLLYSMITIFIIIALLDLYLKQPGILRIFQS